MAILPISDYPASASDKSQAQVLSERKAELNQRLQDVQQSNLPHSAKDGISDSIRGEISTTDQQQQHKLREAAYKEKKQSSDTVQAKQQKAALLKEDDARKQVRASLDTRA